MFSAERGRRQEEEEPSTASCPLVMRGRDGRDGRDGARGDRGDIGPHGEKGDRGEIGPQGTKGEKGYIGPHGEKGEQGEIGLHGVQGKDGYPGLPGPQGRSGMQGPSGPPSSGGGLYTRWGNTSCPSVDGTELLYSGRAAGNQYGTNYVCMPNDPEYSSSSAQGTHWMYGVEYQNYPSRSINGQNVPCAVCYTSSRDTVVMIPAKLTCPSNWSTEYTGYLMTDNYWASQHECVDQNPESISGFTSDREPYEFFPIKVDCNNYGFSCPPYSIANKALTCVVCSH